MLNAESIARILKLEPLPVEGGLFRQTYIRQSADSAQPDSTAIYYMLVGTAFSHMHMLPDDEIYHFYMGSPVELLLLYPDGDGRIITLGTDLEAGQTPQLVVPAGVWQGSALMRGGEYALLGTTMAPGYLPEGYIHGTREALIDKYPAFAEQITRLTQ